MNRKPISKEEVNTSFDLRQFVNQPIGQAIIVGLMAIVLAAVVLWEDSEIQPSSPVLQKAETAFVRIETTPDDVIIETETDELVLDSSSGKYQIPLGNQNLLFSANGFRPHEEEFSIEKNMAPIQIELLPESRPIVVEGLDEEATVFVDSAELEFEGNTVELSLGSHQITFRKESFEDIVEDITVQASEDNPSIVLQWKKKRSLISIVPKPETAEVRIDGQLAKEFAPNSNVYFADLGKVDISVTLQGYVSDNRTITVMEKDNPQQLIELLPLEPAGSTAQGGTTMGETESPNKNVVDPDKKILFLIADYPDSEGTLRIGKREFEFTRGGVEIRRGDIEFGENETVEINVTLESGDSIDRSISRTTLEESSVVRISNPVTDKDEARYLWMFARGAVNSKRNATLAEKQLTQAIRLDDSLAEAYRDRAVARQTLRKTELSRQDFKKAIELGANDFYLHKQYCRLLKSLADTIDADSAAKDNLKRECLDQCTIGLGFRPHNTALLVLQTEINFQFGGNNLITAKSSAERLIKETNDLQQKSYASVVIGLVLQRHGKEVEATEKFREAIAFDNENYAAFLNLGTSLQNQAVVAPSRQSQTTLLQSALSAFRKAMNLYPKAAESLLEKIAKVQADLRNFSDAIEIYSGLIAQYGGTPRRYESRAKLYDLIGSREKAVADRVRAADLRG